MALTLDGSNVTQQGSATTVTISLTTGAGGDIIVVLIDINTDAVSVSSIADVAGLVWNFRAKFDNSSGNTHYIWEYWAYSPVKLTGDVISVGLTPGGASSVVVQALAVAGTPNPGNPWDSGAGLPVKAYGTSAAPFTNFNTATSGAFVIAAFDTTDTPTWSSAAPWNVLGLAAPPSFYTLYSVFATPQTGTVANATISASSDWSLFVDALAGGSAVLAATATATPIAGPLNLAVTFTGSASGGSGPYSYSWSFGDGGTSSAQSPSHTYGTQGPFGAVLTVQDSVGSTAQSYLIIFAGNNPYVSAHQGGSSASSPLVFAPVNAPLNSFIAVFVMGNVTLSSPLQLSVSDNEDNTYTALALTQFGGLPESGSGTNGVWFIAPVASPSSSLVVQAADVTAGPLIGAVVVVSCHGSAAAGFDTGSQVVSSGSGAAGTYSTGKTAHQDSELILGVGFKGSYYGGTVPTESVAVNSPGVSIDAEQEVQAGFATWSELVGSLVGPTPAGAYAYAGTFSPGTNSESWAAAALGVLAQLVSMAAAASPTPPSGAVPLAVAFTPTVTGGAQGYTYLWNFGDGGTSTQATPTYTYQNPGIWNVTLTVTDAIGDTASASAQVNATGSQPGPNPTNPTYTQEVDQPCVAGTPAPLTPLPATPTEETQPSGNLELVPGNYYDRCAKVWRYPNGSVAPGP